MPFTDHIGLTSKYERKKARRRKFLLRWIFLLGLFGLVFLFAILIKRNDSVAQLSSSGAVLPLAMRATLSVAGFITNWWFVCLAVIVVVGLILEMVAEEKGKLTLLYLILLIVIGGLFVWAYHYTSQTADDFLEDVKEKITKPMGKK